MWNAEQKEVQAIEGPWMQGGTGSGGSQGGGTKDDKDTPRPGGSDFSGGSNG